MTNRQEGTYPKRRDLDGVYYRVMREGKADSLCFTDLTTAEQDEFLESLDTKGLQRMCHLIADCLRGIGDQFDIALGDEEDDA
jgi:hypothetical protein